MPVLPQAHEGKKVGDAYENLSETEGSSMKLAALILLLVLPVEARWLAKARKVTLTAACVASAGDAISSFKAARIPGAFTFATIHNLRLKAGQ